MTFVVGKLCLFSMSFLFFLAGQIWARIPGVWIPARRTFALRQQLQLQKRRDSKSRKICQKSFFFICLQQDLTDLICIWYAFGWAKSRKTVLIWFDLIRFDRCKDVKMLSSHFSGDDSERSTCYAGSGFQDSRWVRWVRWRCAVRCAVLCAFSEMCCFLRQGCDERVEEDDRGECTWVRGGYLDNAMLMPDTACSNMM